MKKTLLRQLGLGVCFAIGFAASAQAAVFNFSFNNEDGAVSGTVMGQLTLADGDGAGLAATNVTLLNYPAALGLAPAPMVVGNGGSFTVLGGMITFASYSVAFNPSTALFLNTTGFAALDKLNCACYGTQGVLDSDASSLVFSSTLPAAVPLPASMPLMAAGLGALGVVARRRRRRAA
jgi:hypothetical protein